jgi:hypothetical protein
MLANDNDSKVMPRGPMPPLLGELLMLCCARPVKYFILHAAEEGRAAQPQQLPTVTGPTRAFWWLLGEGAHGERGAINKIGWGGGEYHGGGGKKGKILPHLVLGDARYFLLKLPGRNNSDCCLSPPSHFFFVRKLKNCAEKKSACE